MIIQEQKRYETVFGFNTKQWWIYDSKDDVYIDIPIKVLEEIKSYSNNIDKQEDYLNKILNKLPNWLNDTDYTYSDIDI